MSSRQNNIDPQESTSRRPDAGEAESVEPLGSHTWYTMVNYDSVISAFKKVPQARRVFFTVKNNAKPWTMDRCRKWLKQFTTTYVVVQSPKGGVHHHGIFTTDVGRTVRHCKGVHMLLTPLGKPKKEELCPRIPRERIIEREMHPVYQNLDYPNIDMPYEWAEDVMDINREIDCMKSSLPKRIKSRKAAAVRRSKVGKSVEAGLEYLKKNFYENTNPQIYKHVNVKITS